MLVEERGERYDTHFTQFRYVDMRIKFHFIRKCRSFQKEGREISLP
jgi:hypothetical protein